MILTCSAPSSLVGRIAPAQAAMCSAARASSRCNADAPLRRCQPSSGETNQYVVSQAGWGVTLRACPDNPDVPAVERCPLLNSGSPESDRHPLWCPMQRAADLRHPASRSVRDRPAHPTIPISRSSSLRYQPPENGARNTRFSATMPDPPCRCKPPTNQRGRSIACSQFFPRLRIAISTSAWIWAWALASHGGASDRRSPAFRHNHGHQSMRGSARTSQDVGGVEIK